MIYEEVMYKVFVYGPSWCAFQWQI